MAQALYIKQLAERIGIAETAILERIKDISADKSRPISAGVSTNAPLVGSQNRNEKKSVLETGGPEDIFSGNRVERQIIAMMIQFPEILPDISNYKVLELFNDDRLKSIG